MSEKAWQVFYTATSNEVATPGVTRLFIVFKVTSQCDLSSDKLNEPSTYEPQHYLNYFIDYDVNTCNNYCEKHSHLMNRMHNSKITYS